MVLVSVTLRQNVVEVQWSRGVQYATVLATNHNNAARRTRSVSAECVARRAKLNEEAYQRVLAVRGGSQ